MSILYVLVAILLLGILVAVHEFGHFIAARLTGIEVMEFSIGMGPRLCGWKSRRHGTAFNLRAIPMGGYCAFYGEDDAEGKHVDDPRAYNRQPVWKRMISVLAGPGMNFVLAFVVAALYFWIGGVGEVTGVTPYISQVMAAGPAYEAGLRDGDVIEEIDGVNMLDGTMETLLDAIGAYRPGDPAMTVTVLRGESTFVTTLTPVYDEAEGKARIDVYIGGVNQVVMRPATLPEAIAQSWNTCVYASGVILDALKAMVTTGEGLDQASGPVGVVSQVSEQVRAYGFEAFVNMLVVISINLGIMNLLPIPGLDGSRFLFMLLEAVRRKPVPPQKEAMVHLAGMVFLIAVMIFFTFRDVLNLFR